MRRKKSFVKRPRQSSEMSLQITSMADIFMILLVFLLKSYSTGSFQIAPSAGMSLPQAKLSDQATQALKVEVSENAVLVEGHPVAKMSRFIFDGGDVDPSGISKSLVGALSQARGLEAASKSRQLPGAVANQNGAETGEADPRIVVIADQRAPYQTIKTVLASAAMQGYTDVKLAVVHAE